MIRCAAFILLLSSSSLALAAEEQKDGLGNGFTLYHDCKAPDDYPDDDFYQRSCIRYLDGMLAALAYKAQQEGVCRFDISNVRAHESIRKDVVAWLRLRDDDMEVLSKPDAEILETILSEQYPCK